MGFGNRASWCLIEPAGELTNRIGIDLILNQGELAVINAMVGNGHDQDLIRIQHSGTAADT